jgi:hypothetical protein
MRRHIVALLTGFVITFAASAARAEDWQQWGQNAQHAGVAATVGQPARHILADIVYDPFVELEKNDDNYGGSLDVHYQVPLADGDDLFIEVKSGNFTDIFHWETQTWNERALRVDHGQVKTLWSFASDWKPVPYGGGPGPAWEPVFHAALAGNYVYVPGAGGSIFKLRKGTGAVVARIRPFGATLDPHTFTVGPPTVDANGNVYYNVLKLAAVGEDESPWEADIAGAWLVKVSPHGAVSKATYASLTPGALQGEECVNIFSPDDFPWPPSPDAVAPKVPCGSQRPALNASPAVAPNGTVYVVSIAHLTNRTAYLVAVNPNLTPKWIAGLMERFHDGCNVLLPPNGTPGGCREGAHTGVDPAQNLAGGGRVPDDGSSSPVVAPDGSILFGADSRYNYGQGHLMKFSASGQFLAAYPFGWDTTPAVFGHDGTYSVFVKDNQYGERGSYCNTDPFCPDDRDGTNPNYPEGFFITRLNSDLVPEWRFPNTNTEVCDRDEHGQVSCVDDGEHDKGFEWCINALVVDRRGNVYANAEDGFLYVIKSNGKLRESMFLDQAVGAAYTPLSLKGDGLILTQNNGHLFVIGNK